MVKMDITCKAISRDDRKVLHSRWTGIRSRCNNKKATGYKNYGGKGITICKEWDDFHKFCEWAILNGYKKELHIDRIDSFGNYEPSNCRFVTIAENIRNKDNLKLSYEKVRQLKKLYASGSYSYRSLARKYGINKGTAWNAVNDISWN